MNDSMNRLETYIRHAVTPYHAAIFAGDTLKNAGFTPLKPNEPWTIEKGSAYYTTVADTMTVAFTVGSDWQPEDQLRIAAAHIDWPCLHIKPNPEMSAAGCLRLNIEPYGGLIYDTWLDRPLSLAGIAVIDDEQGIRTVPVDFETPLLTIPSVAIHMNRDQKRDYNPRVDLIPILRTNENRFEKNGYLVTLIAEKLNVPKTSVVSFDLIVYNAEIPCAIGPDDTLYSAPRLDNLTSASACLYGIVDAIGKERGIQVSVLYDHEEIGSKTRSGAASETLNLLLEKVYLALGSCRSAMIDAMFSGMLLSCDVAHAIHPNHPEYADPTCTATIGRGVVLKLNTNQRYPTDFAAVSRIEKLCRQNDIPVQKFMNRADMAGGGTIGADASSHLGMTAIDCGVPIWGMHSARETMASSDQIAMEQLVKAFFKE